MVGTSYKGLFHGILATHSISEAISYYRLFRRSVPNLKVVALFDPTVDGEMDPTTAVIKDEALEEILEDYNTYFNQNLLYQVILHLSVMFVLDLRISCNIVLMM